MRDSYELEVLLKMTAKEWLDKNNINLSEYHGNIGDYEEDICIETDKWWIFWNANGKRENRLKFVFI